MSVLITGGTGSFGQAFTQYLVEKGVGRICIYSRDEAKQAEMAAKYKNNDQLRFFVGDVRDKSRLTEALRDIDIVIHAAALKRIEVGHYNPTEMVKTNVIGVMNLIEASVMANVKKVVFLSTDKAYQPISAYGQSKALAESMVLAANHMHGAHGPEFAVTRYGNVSGSKGSVIPVWKKMIAEGCEIVPVTDPECTRFWMTMDEAVHLVDKAVMTMPKDVLIPGLPAYRLGDLATAMEVQMHITGLPKYEKKHEGMADGNTSDIARRMSVEELKEALKYV